MFSNLKLLLSTYFVFFIKAYLKIVFSVQKIKVLNFSIQKKKNVSEEYVG